MALKGKFFILIICCCVLIIAPISIWLFIYAQTSTCIALSLLGIIISIFLIALPFKERFQIRRPVWRVFIVITILEIIVCLTVIIINIPDGNPSTGRISHQFTGTTRFNRYTLANIVPEVEQVNLGFQVVPYLDPILTVEQSNRVREFTLDLYKEMDRDADFRELGSAMGWAYNELMGQPYSVGHYYLYIPENPAGTPMPAIVFLHGSAGNFKAYTYLFSKLAERHGYVVISPSFGFGNWDCEEGVDVVLEALEDAQLQASIDLDRIYLAGLSNGGIGVSRAANHSPERFKGLIWISPVMDTSIVDSQSFIEKWKGRPVLILSGEKDRRVPVEYVNKRAKLMKSGGILTDLIIYPDEDHFLLFSQSLVLNNISDWLIKS